MWTEALMQQCIVWIQWEGWMWPIMDYFFLTLHIFTPYIMRLYRFALSSKAPAHVSAGASVEARRTRVEARNRKRPPWVLLQSDEQRQKQHRSSAERQKEHLTTWVHIIFPPSPLQHRHQELSPLTWHAANSAPIHKSHIDHRLLQSVEVETSVCYLRWRKLPPHLPSLPPFNTPAHHLRVLWHSHVSFSC